MGFPVSASTTCPILGRTASVGSGRGNSVAHPANGQTDAKTNRNVALCHRYDLRRLTFAARRPAGSKGPTRRGTLMACARISLGRSPPLRRLARSRRQRMPLDSRHLQKERCLPPLTRPDESTTIATGEVVVTRIGRALINVRLNFGVLFRRCLDRNTAPILVGPVSHSVL